MRLALTAFASLLLLAACSSSSDDTDTLQTAAPPPADQGAADVPAKDSGPTISTSDAQILRNEIYPHWVVPPQPKCDRPLKVRIDLNEDGSVIRALARPELAYDDPCRQAMDAAIRAVWAATPLTVPRHRDWSSLTLIFDQNVPQN